MSERTVIDEDTYDQILDIFQGAATIDATKSDHAGNSIELRDSKKTDQLVEVEFVRGHGKRLVKETGCFISGIRQHTGDDPCIEVWFDEIPDTDEDETDETDDREIEVEDGAFIRIEINN
jgi:hypothetical protein